MSLVPASAVLPPWIGTPPDSWQTKWLKWDVSLRADRPSEKEVEELPYISNEDIESWTGHLLRTEVTPSSAEGRKFSRDDILFNRLRPYLAKVFQAPFTGVSSGELLCLRSSESVLPRYLFYVVSSKAFIDAVNAETFGSKMPRADWEIVGHQPLPRPPIETQKRIAAFLDEKTAHIDALIAKKHALLERLDEKQQAIITQAVTKGLDRAAPLVASGIAWFGEIPASWRIRRLNSICDFQSGKAHEPFIDPDGVYVCVNARFISTNGSVEKRCTKNLCPTELGDILMVMSDLPNGRALARTFLVDDLSAYAVNQRVCRLRFQTGKPRYFSYQLNRNPQLLRYDDGNEQTHLTNSAFKQLLLLDPPVTEQQQIVAYLDAVLSRINMLVVRVRESLDVLSEYRAALITSAVTGQIGGLQ